MYMNFIINQFELLIDLTFTEFTFKMNLNWFNYDIDFGLSLNDFLPDVNLTSLNIMKFLW